MGSEEIFKQIEINEHMRNKVEQRMDKVCCAVLLLINTLRESSQVEGKDVVTSIPTETLDRIEKLLTN
jgi:hypothetical protein